LDIRELIEEQMNLLEVNSPDDNSDDIPTETDGESEELEDEETPEDEAVESEDSDAEVDDDEGEPVAEDELVVEVLENAKLKLPDGTLVDADKAVLMQADYTRKTQELAEQRKAFESEKEQLQGEAAEVMQAYQSAVEWYESRASKPADWVTEIISGTEDPTSTLAKAIYDLAQAGALEKSFVESFGIEQGEVAERAKEATVTDELAEIRAWKRQQEEEQARKQAIAQQADVYERQWEEIKTTRGLEFSDRVEELDVKRHLLQFAMDNKLGRSLVDAFDLMTVRSPISVSKQVPAPDPAVAAKKRANRAVTPKTAVSGNVKKPKKNISTRDALLEAMEEVTSRRA
jgi:hypothetical protein